MDESKKNNLLQKILYEAKAYNTYEDIEKLAEDGTDLSMVPIQPLYMSLIASTPSQLAEVLPKLSKEQRQAFIDLDLWKKDIVDPETFEFWIDTYSRVMDEEIIKDFASSEDFYLYLKSRVNIHTFDAEDPMYPDHDFYFLTDDNLLLVEYGEDYQFPNELKVLIRHMYDTFGVEGAYTTLFKLINDSFSKIQEDGFQLKKERLRDFGFVDHYEAMEKLHPFSSYSQIKKMMSKKGKETGLIDSKGQNQSLHSSALVSFNSDMENILEELAKVESEKRKIFLHFTFIRLINSTITLRDALKGGRIELTKIGAETRTLLDLALYYIKDFDPSVESIFDSYDFFDLYKIGASLIQIEKTKMKKALRGKSFEDSSKEYFLGAWWQGFVENSFLEIPKVKNFGVGLHATYINDLVTFNFWKRNVKLFCESTALIEQFAVTFEALRADDKLRDQFYLNYNVEEIEFESILVSSFINLALDPKNTNPKLGLSIQEFKLFISEHFIFVDGEHSLKMKTDSAISNYLDVFLAKYGLTEIEFMGEYIYGILYENLSGYDYNSLTDEEFKHVGGPILLNIGPIN
jgi:hypothetical protein